MRPDGQTKKTEADPTQKHRRQDVGGEFRDSAAAILLKRRYLTQVRKLLKGRPTVVRQPAAPPHARSRSPITRRTIEIASVKLFENARIRPKLWRVQFETACVPGRRQYALAIAVLIADMADQSTSRLSKEHASA